MSELVTITINGQTLTCPSHTSVAAALFRADELTFRTSLTGQPRSAVCGMGICFECRVTINGRPHSRSCQTLVSEGMIIHTT